MNQNFRNKQQRKKTGGRAALFLGIAAFVIVLVVGITAIVLLGHEPDVTPLPNFSTDAPTSPVSTDETTSASAEPVNPYERKEDFYTFLVAGLDQVSRSTDVLMLVSFDTQTGAIQIVQIPRDTYINKTVAGYSAVSRVNGIFAAEYNDLRAYYGKTKKEAEITDTAMKTLCTKLSAALCVNIDNYVLIDTDGFREVIDAVGGIDYDVPFDMDYEDPYQDLQIHLKAGYQHLDGEKCEQLIRNRSGYLMGDVDRVDLRSKFLVEAFRQIKSKVTLGTMLDLIPIFFENVTTSMAVKDMAFFAKKVYAFGTDQIESHRISGYTTDDTPYYYLEKTGALADVNAYLNVFSADISENIFDQEGLFEPVEE